MHAALAVLLTLGIVSGGQSSDVVSRVGARRVAISLTFSGERVFLHGQPAPGAQQILAVIEGPGLGRKRIMRQGRIAFFWLGVKQYKIKNAPGLHLVNVHCPVCNGMEPCDHRTDLDEWNLLLADSGQIVGPGALGRQVRLTDRGGGAVGSEEVGRALRGFWDLQASRGLYSVRENAIRVNPQGLFYHAFDLPTGAPEGRYRITTYFAREGRIVGVSENELLVRKSGPVAWMTRLAERSGAIYGGLSVAIAVLAGVLANAVFRRGDRH
jgi:hypothetical protein